MDAEIRDLQRRAREGDESAAEKLERVKARASTPETLLGIGCWWSVGSDSYAGTIVATWRNAQQITAQQDLPRWDLWKPEDGTAVCLHFDRDPDGPRIVFTKRQDGVYRIRGGQQRLHIGERQSYGDPSF